MKLLVNLLCDDIDAVCVFFGTLLGLPELAASRSPIYRALDTGAGELGFNAPAARPLLGLDGDGAAGTRCFATFLLDHPSDVDAACRQAAALGGQVVKPPYRTYYGQWQAVLAGGEGHVFRVGCTRLPESAGPS